MAQWLAQPFYTPLVGEFESLFAHHLLLAFCHFFQINPTYRTKLKNVWNVNKQEVPSRIHKKLNLPSPDPGIDLLAETNAKV